MVIKNSNEIPNVNMTLPWPSRDTFRDFVLLMSLCRNELCDTVLKVSCL